MIMTIMFINLMIMNLTHPMTMGVTLLIQTILVAMIINYMNMNFWFSYIMILVMIGGMLVLFMYMTSIASNEKFKISMKLLMYFPMLLTLTLMNLFNDKMIINNTMLESLNTNYNFNLNLIKFMNFPSSMMMFFMIIYLFITLIAVVKITNIKYGPIRQKL
uniref:NADH-ubiquinone oxidoreductase chain 6 n=1 Tax=Staphylinoidea sp. 14 KM-2017 TaxID=2219454 RepID=A0A346RJ31_9COLE|nr:NADH dehydrogenase subunit 6 [Staphylinoidea sp. 14 KM-2017]